MNTLLDLIKIFSLRNIISNFQLSVAESISKVMNKKRGVPIDSPKRRFTG